MRKNTLTLSKHFVLHQLCDDVFAAIAKDGGSAICNSGLIDLGGQVLVFDTFLTPEAARDLRLMAINAFDQSPRIIINSHYHNDHIWGNQVFESEAQIISSSRTRALIATAGAEEYQAYKTSSSQRLESLRAQNPETEIDQQQQLLWTGYYEGLVKAFTDLRVCMPGVTFDNHLEIHGNRLTVELITVEGAHTENDTYLHLPKEGIVLTGDLLFVGCHPYLADGDPLQLLKALGEIGHLDATYFVPGHGPVGTAQDIRSMIEYVDACLEAGYALVDEGNVDEDRIKELKIPDQFIQWNMPQFWPVNIRFICERLNSAK
jgi:glyoxylase-like metal-dependent hydrolase (beta-lactamase superfamily II)